MAKTFWEILAEADDEYVYYIHSTAPIHRPDMFEKVKLSLMPYEIKSIECESYKPLTKANTMFPEEPNTPTFTIKVVTRYPLTKGFLSTLAMDAHIHIAHLKITPDKTLEPMNEPEEVPSKDAQSLVGNKRIAEFIKELQADRKARDDMSWNREVYESFYTTHLGLESAIKKPLKKGYYIVETFQEGGKHYLRAEGPFDSRPEGNAYHDRIRTVNPQIISETMNGGLYGVQVLVENIKTK
jgi:hypothetical protein